jgi:hypothetical protein
MRTVCTGAGGSESVRPDGRPQPIIIKKKKGKGILSNIITVMLLTS